MDSKRLETFFYELLVLRGVSFHERLVADYLLNHFRSRGIDIREDDTAAKVGGESGNIIARIPGNGKGLQQPGICILTHMDTVKYDGEVHFRTDANRVVWADNSPILGGDDRAGIAIVMELYEVLLASRFDHPPIVLVFTIAEESGLVGANNLDIASLNCSTGFVLDCSSKPGTIIVQAPRSVGLEVQVTGLAAHAGIAPERGISALMVLAEALSHMKMGRVDDETTANWGVIKGGQATNIIMPEISVLGEVRSLDPAKLDKQLAHIKEELERAMVKFTINDDCKPQFKIIINDHYYSYYLSSEDTPVKMAVTAMEALGIKPEMLAWGGGSDANVLNHLGLPTVNLAIGMDDVHGPREHISLIDLETVVSILLEVAKQV